MAVSESDSVDLPNIVIRSEEDAYAVLQRADAGDIGPYGRIIFDGWPTLSLYLRGEKFNQSLTPTVMRGLIELQKGVYRSYAIAKSSSVGSRLSDEERDAFEFKVTVDAGSSLYGIDFQEIAETFVTHLAQRMNPTEVVIVVVSIAALYFGQSAYKTYLQNRKEVRVKEISDETTRKMLDAMQFASEQETKRTAIIASLAAKDPRVDQIERSAYTAQTEVIKSLATGTSAKIGDVPISPVAAAVLTQNARRTSNEVNLDGTYRLLKIDWTNPDVLKVKVYNVVTGLQLDAEVHDDSLTGRYKEILKSAEWARQAVRLEITAKLLGENEYRDAVITGVQATTAIA